MAALFNLFKKTKTKPVDEQVSPKSKHQKKADQEAQKKANTVSRQIDAQMAKDHEVLENQTIKILFLGPGDSGKTTIVKQMKYIHGSLTPEERALPTQYIREAVVTYMSILCRQSQELSCLNHQTECEKKNQEISDQFADGDIEGLNVETADKIKTLWSDPGIKRTLALRSLFQIHDNVAYFLEKVHELASPDYSPSFEDYIRIRSRTTGFQSHKIKAKIDGFGRFTFDFVDVGGQRSERKKWMYVMKDDIQAVLFVIGLSEYDMMCFEDVKVNRLHEALELFKSTLSTNFLHQKSALLFFNKFDLFKEKIKKVPITVAFKDYPADQDPHDVDQTAQFVADKFEDLLEKSGVQLATPLHIHRTTALDTNNISKLFHSITSDLVKQNLQRYGII